MDKRILICGASGTGKTTLAEWISHTYRIPFISTSTKPLWEEYGITSHTDLLAMNAEDPKKGIVFQHQLLEYRRDKLRGISNYVSDRSPIDNLVYFLMQNAQYATTEETNNYIQKCKDSLELLGTHIIYIPFTTCTELEDDGMRIVNRHYQHIVSHMFDYVFERNLLDTRSKQFRNRTLVIEEWDWSKRMDKVIQLTRETIFTKAQKKALRLWAKAKGLQQ